uniref:Uncharacterized protein n=1 Tax=Anopheles epiroticus TaxID=199890 RepID=A0A182PWI1_9DIPT
RIRLPEIHLPAFDGSFETWLSFSDAFKSLIDSNKGALVKDAQKIIADIDCTATNYSVAWELHEGRYQNKKLVVKRYLDALTGIAAVKRESYESLTNLIDGFERNINATKKLGLNIELHCTSFRSNWKFHIIREITWNLPHGQVNNSKFIIPSELNLADPRFYESSPIDLLIGRESCIRRDHE